MISSSFLPACVLALLVLCDSSCVEDFCLQFRLSLHGFLSGGASSSILTVNRHFLQEFLVLGTSYDEKSFL